MEYLLLVLALGSLVAGIFIREAYSAKKKEKQFIASLYEDYGRPLHKEYPLERYMRMDSFYRRHKREGQIDDITWNDLDMDDVFKQMNYTFSASGEEYLYYTLRNTAGTVEELEHLETVVSYFMGHPDERVKVQYLMSKLGYTGKYSLYDYLENLDNLGERSNRKHILCSLLFLPLIAAAPFALSASLLGIAVLVVYNIMTYFGEQSEIDPYIVSFAYIVRLLNTCEKLVKVEAPPCKDEWERVRESIGRLKSVGRNSFFVFSKNRYSTSGNPLDILMDYLRMVFHLDLIQFNGMLRKVRSQMEYVDRMIAVVGYVETAIAIGEVRASLKNGYCVPEFVENAGKGVFEAAGCYHPLLKEPVKNSIRTEGGVLITGSNASGKSTFLKTLAVNVLLAQTLHTCTADSYRAPLCALYSSMALKDSIQGGESYYIVEIRALKRILDAVGKQDRTVVCFVDEVLRGTNTVERIAASTQILKSLCSAGCLCFAATHDIELTELLKEDYDNYHFEEEIHGGDVVFPYLLMKGQATTRNAIRLLEIMGYDEDIIRRAHSLAENFVNTGKWL